MIEQKTEKNTYIESVNNLLSEFAKLSIDDKKACAAVINNEIDQIEQKKIAQRKWDREEVVLLVVNYFQTKGMPAEIINESRRKLSNFLKFREFCLTKQRIPEIFRNEAGIRMQSDAIKGLDPDTPQRGTTATKLQAEIVQEFLSNPKAIIKEAETIYHRYILL